MGYAPSTRRRAIDDQTAFPEVRGGAHILCAQRALAHLRAIPNDFFPRHAGIYTTRAPSRVLIIIAPFGRAEAPQETIQPGPVAEQVQPHYPAAVLTKPKR